MPIKDKLPEAIHMIKRRKLSRFFKVVANYFLYNLYTRKHLPAYCFSRPVHLQVEISRVCNLRCKMCEYSYKKEQKILMKFEQFKKVLSGFPQLHSLDLTGIGESFCNPEFIKMLHFVKTLGLKVEFSTNGLLMNEAHVDELVAMEVDKISFSIDAATKETHEKIRQGSSFERVVENIARLSKAASLSPRGKPTLYMSYIVTNENLKEVEHAVPLAKKLGVQTIVFRDLLVFDSGVYTEKDKADKFDKDFRYQLGKKILQQAELVGIEVNLSRSLSEGDVTKKIFCHRPWRSGFVDVFGNLYPCCRLTQKNIDITSLSFGNVLSQDFKTIWNDTKYKSLRKDLVHPTKIPPLCRGCACLRK